MHAHESTALLPAVNTHQFFENIFIFDAFHFCCMLQFDVSVFFTVSVSPSFVRSFVLSLHSRILLTVCCQVTWLRAFSLVHTYALAVRHARWTAPVRVRIIDSASMVYRWRSSEARSGSIEDDRSLFIGWPPLLYRSRRAVDRFKRTTPESKEKTTSCLSALPPAAKQWAIAESAVRVRHGS